MVTDHMAPRLARILKSTRRGDVATLSMLRIVRGEVHPELRTSRGGRICDAYGWALAAHGEIMDRSPTWLVQTRSGGPHWVAVRPWRLGKASAWAYLHEAAEAPLGAPARQILKDLARRGITQEKP